MSKHDYEVGYKKPPRKHQFKKGHSGNPRGRPKRVRMTTEELIESEFNRLIKVNGGELIPAYMAITRSLVIESIKGNTKIGLELLRIRADLERRYGPPPPSKVYAVMFKGDTEGATEVVVPHDPLREPKQKPRL